MSLSTAAAAQDMPVFTPSMSWPEAGAINQFGLLASQAADREVREDDERARPSVTAADMTFTPSSARRRANYDRFVKRSSGKDPAGAQNLAAILQGDPVKQMGPELAKVGLTTSNVADAYTVYWVEAWQAAHGVTGSSSREVAQAVKQQATNAIAAVPSFTKLTDADKQQFAEAMLVQALLIGAAKEQAAGDARKLREIARAVEQGASAMGLDLRAMNLTDEGFVPAARTGAADPALTTPGEAPQALAATEDADGSPSLVVLAAAGGAGLGAAFLLGKAMGRTRA